MDLLKDLLNLGKLDEDKSRSMDELLDKFMSDEGIHHFEGSRGRRNFEKIVNVFGYDDIDSFLDDNPGCYEAMIEWIKDSHVQDWVEALENHLGDEGKLDEGYESKVLNILKDNEIYGRFANGALYVQKDDVEKAKKLLNDPRSNIIRAPKILGE